MPATAAISKFRDAIDGVVIDPASAEYEAARRIWNGDIDKHPALVARPTDVAGVQATIRIAAESGLELAVRGGGHSFAGHSTCDGGVVLDLGAMRGVQVDTAARRAHVAGGALLGDLDRAVQAHGLVTPAGVVSHTGVAGLTLGGGHGYLSRRFGLSCDNLREVDLVTADGDLRTVNDELDPELMWGLRGGGGNFGVVTRFEFDTHVLDQPVLTGWLVYPFDIAQEFLAFYNETVLDMPEPMCPTVRLMVPDSSPVLPAEVQGSGQSFIGLRYVWSGDLDEGRAQMDKLVAWRRPIVSSVRETPFVELQCSADATARHGVGRYAKCGYLADMSPALIDGMIRLQTEAPSELCEIVFVPLGGAVARVDEQATAYSCRSAALMFELRTAWTDPADRAEVVGWVRRAWDFFGEHALSGEYSNMINDDEGVMRSYGATKYERLAQVKARLDPDNFFHLNQNVRPANR